ncbi:MAG: hypothetical protein OXN84_01905 [Albidovulum sp.]|nr:hypothetical protein [Albidovulum sp.]
MPKDWRPVSGAVMMAVPWLARTSRPTQRPDRMRAAAEPVEFPGDENTSFPQKCLHAGF